MSYKSTSPGVTLALDAVVKEMCRCLEGTGRPPPRVVRGSNVLDCWLNALRRA